MLKDQQEIKLNAVYTTKESQELLKVSPSTIKRLLKRGIIRANKVGGQYRILGRELLRVISPEVEVKTANWYQGIKAKVQNTIEDW